MAETILIVEDEPDLVETLRFNCCREGYETRVAYDGKTALEELAKTPAVSLVLLDLMLPDVSGTEVCRRIRSVPETEHIPVVMLTARDEEIDRVVGLELGADDYVIKPFSTRELMLRIRAILRRAQPLKETTKSVGLGDVRLDLEGHRTWVGQEELSLTALEFKLLATLVTRRGRVQTRERLLEDVWEVRPGVTSRTVDTHVRRLRRKLGSASNYVETIRGVGYRFCAPAPGPEAHDSD